MKKPSERIEEIYNSKLKIFVANDDIRNVGMQAEVWLNSIGEYLDEEYEKNKPCEHEWRQDSAYTLEYCKKCKIVKF